MPCAATPPPDALRASTSPLQGKVKRARGARAALMLMPMAVLVCVVMDMLDPLYVATAR